METNLSPIRARPQAADPEPYCGARHRCDFQHLSMDCSFAGIALLLAAASVYGVVGQMRENCPLADARGYQLWIVR
jgi:hypothetical protein